MPKRKVGIGALVGSLTSLIVWVAGLNGLIVPPEAAASLTTVLTFIASYMTPEQG